MSSRGPASAAHAAPKRRRTGRRTGPRWFHKLKGGLKEEEERPALGRRKHPMSENAARAARASARRMQAARAEESLAEESLGEEVPEEVAEEVPEEVAALACLSRAEVQAQCATSGRPGREGTTFVAVTAEGTRYAIKMFRKTKSINKIKKEVQLQNEAAARGIAPQVHAVNATEKYIVMDCLRETLVAYMDLQHTQGVRPLSAAHETRLMEICDTLDALKILHNDSNPLNLMVDDDGKLFLIDFGFSKRMTAVTYDKYGAHPNISLSLCWFVKMLRRHRIGAALCKARVDGDAA